MGKIASAVQLKISDSSKSIALFLFKLFSGIVIGLTLALIGQQIIGFSNLAFFFVITVVSGVFLRVAKGWNAVVMTLFDLFILVAALLLKMYVVMAP